MLGDLLPMQRQTGTPAYFQKRQSAAAQAAIPQQQEKKTKQLQQC